MLDADPPPSWTTLSYSQTSPAAQTPGGAGGSCASQLMPPLSPSSMPAALREHHVRRHADAADDELRVELAPALGHDALDAPRALEAIDLVAADDADAALAEHAAEEAPGVVAEPARERLVLQHHDRDVLAERRQRGRDLAADVGAADADDVLDALQLAADRVAVAERADVVQPVELVARTWSRRTIEPVAISALS